MSAEPKSAIEVLNDHGFYTADQAAFEIGLSEGAIRQAVARGHLEADRSVRSILIFSQDSIEKYRAYRAETYTRIDAPHGGPSA